MIYFIGTQVERPVKVGHAKDPVRRLSTLQTGSAERLNLLCAFEGGQDLEQSYHRILQEFRVRGEWFEWRPVVSLLKLIHGHQVPETDLGLRYPGAADLCPLCEWNETFVWPNSVVSEKDGWLVFGFKGACGHFWTCGYSERLATSGLEGVA